MLHRKISKDIIVHLQSDRDKIRIFDGNNAKNKTDIEVRSNICLNFILLQIFIAYTLLWENAIITLHCHILN